MITTAEFRAASGCFGTGITVVTTFSAGAEPADGAERVARVDHAMTANSFTSVSLEPRLVLVCAERSTRFHDAVLASGVWGVSILAVEGRDAARRLAVKGRALEGQLDDFRHVRGPETGCALLEDSLATLECRTWATHEAGDHTIVVGEVVGLAIPGPDRAALAYHRGRYAVIDPL